MKLLFDQNLSPRLPRTLIDVYPESVHVQDINMRDATDTDVWEYAKDREFVIVSKDSDFQARSLLYGSPPKFIWLRAGNCSVKVIEQLLRQNSIVIYSFVQDKTQSHLLLP